MTVLFGLACFVFGALIIQMVRAEVLFSQIRAALKRFNAVIPIIEGHGKTSDAVAQRVVEAVRDVKRDTVQAATVAKEAAQAIAEVPKKVADVLDAKRASDSAGDSGTLPVFRSPEGKP